MDRTDLIIALSYYQDIQKDVDALVCRIAGIGRRNPLVDRLGTVIEAENKVIDFIGNSGEIWADTGREDLRERLYVNGCLESFKQYERLWASRKHERTPEEDWYKMQDELANYINNHSFI